MPTHIGVIDLMIQLPKDPTAALRWGSMLRDRDSLEALKHPAGYMYRDAPATTRSTSSITDLLAEMDRFGVERGLLYISEDDPQSIEAVTMHPDRFLGALDVDPNLGMAAVRALTRYYESYGIAAAVFFPAGCAPQVPINDKRAFPIYAKCVELDIPIFVNAGVPGPRVPMACQDPGLADEVCWFFPDLRFVFRHGCMPWAELTAQLLLKWPNLYYSTSAYAPKYYPEAIVQLANTRAADKIMYAGYHPSGLTLERIFSELPDVPFRDHVWPKFLRENAIRVLKLSE
jgi:hypothetical protein